MIVAAIFTITNRSKQPSFPLEDEWINEVSYKHTMEYYSALKMKKIFSKSYCIAQRAIFNVL